MKLSVFCQTVCLLGLGFVLSTAAVAVPLTAGPVEALFYYPTCPGGGDDCVCAAEVRTFEFLNKTSYEFHGKAMPGAYGSIPACKKKDFISQGTGSLGYKHFISQTVPGCDQDDGTGCQLIRRCKRVWFDPVWWRCDHYKPDDQANALMSER